MDEKPQSMAMKNRAPNIKRLETPYLVTVGPESCPGERLRALFLFGVCHER